ncbi:hypothetical protein M422DRAFT_262369 [Sphaerobolus stellatus SS14]|uniref:Unplaced genomic scaffold SPHSTscaffold_114, whole genome shotgun sequence n=1 Tax=Sphaerobolus stellatus (strain SS14) TaxID=990650 RepID=A0A0C9VDG8_SPHS4|nr:hypothetical protein M422DRAFT_262369 [Sphaerobolus stellatus SS14]
MSLYTLQSIMIPLSAAKHNQVLSLLSSGLSSRDIKHQNGVSKSTVSEVAREYEPDKENHPGGHPQKLTPMDKRAKFVTVQNIRNVLKDDNIKTYPKKKRPYLSPKHRKARLTFALKCENWILEHWKCALWLDEIKINWFGSDGHKYVWKNKGGPLQEKDVESTVKFGGGHIMVWGCMEWNGVRIFCDVEGKMDANLYVSILEEYMLESIKELQIPEEKVIFQQDNGPKCTSKLASNWF